ncbi:MAG: deoxyhypusine synthase family protein [Candidatus Eisenbacteria bacterium]|nr:deoxyhypusine synthase family protein [Candidatus Eisenbacteria bacterium]
MTETRSPGEGALRPRPLEIGMSVSQFIDRAFLGSAAGRVASVADLLAREVYRHPEALVGVSLDAELLSAGLGIGAFAPLLQAGFIDWAVITGPNLFHDALHALGVPFYRTGTVDSASFEDCGGGVSLKHADLPPAEQTLAEIFSGVDFQQTMSSAALLDRFGTHLRARGKTLGVEYPGLLTTAHEAGVPIFNSSPGDSPLGSLLARLGLMGNRLALDGDADLNEAAAILNSAQSKGIPCAMWCLGRGAASAFALGVPRHLRALVGPERAPGYAITIRMAGRVHELPARHCPEIPAQRSSSAPAEEPSSPQAAGSVRDLALSTDLSMAVPLLTTYLLDRVPARPSKRLGGKRSDLLDRLRQDHSQFVLRRPVG